MAREVRPVSAEQIELRDRLFAEGLLIPSGVDGVYGHDSRFEAVRDGLARLLETEARQRGAVQMRFPPVLPVHQLESSGYLANMPHLAGTVFGFEGGEAEAALQASRASEHEDWSEFQFQTELSLLPAACYPVYPALAQMGPLPERGVFVDAGGAWVFRHEPSQDPARRQMFHQHELVRAGTPETVLDWRSEWAQLGMELLVDFGLDVSLERASDPFFGRRGRMLSQNQLSQSLKLELLVRIVGDEPTACASFNHHADHFAGTFSIRAADGAPVHTACLGFGHERIVLALLARHGFDPDTWPAEVRDRLFAGPA